MTHNPDDLLTLWQPMLPLDRPFDLPPAWDGTPIVWQAWEDEQKLTVLMCPPPKTEPCEVCHSTAGWLSARGDGTNRFRPLVLFAWRCRSCRHDQVWDMTHDVVWDLDESDYQSSGSFSKE